ncbi:cell wall anchor protein [Pelomyxa schiedti]|nr:cell wall anchor protein [Pelomyxa schiedti]
MLDFSKWRKDKPTRTKEQQLPELGPEEEARQASGRLVTWGRGTYGRCGNGSEDDVVAPRLMPRLTHVVAVACGAGHSLCVTVEGRALAWGKNYLGQLGVGDEDDRHYPAMVEGLNGVRISKVSGGGNYSAFLSQDGELFTTGCGFFHATGHPSEKHLSIPTKVAALKGHHVVDVSCGAIHGVALCDEGVCFSWGENDVGQCGVGCVSKHVPEPSPVALPPGLLIKHISCGKKWCGVITKTGELWLWGKGPMTTDPVPQPINHALPQPAASCSCSHFHMLALLADGSVWASGTLNLYGALGSGTREPTARGAGVAMQHPPGVAVASLHTGVHHSLLRSASGDVYVCGDDLFGDNTPGQPRLPMDTPVHTDQLVPVRVALGPLADGRVAALACNTFHMLVATSL